MKYVFAAAVVFFAGFLVGALGEYGLDEMHHNAVLTAFSQTAAQRGCKDLGPPQHPEAPLAKFVEKGFQCSDDSLIIVLKQ